MFIISERLESVKSALLPSCDYNYKTSTVWLGFSLDFHKYKSWIQGNPNLGFQQTRNPRFGFAKIHVLGFSQIHAWIRATFRIQVLDSCVLTLCTSMAHAFALALEGWRGNYKWTKPITYQEKKLLATILHSGCHLAVRWWLLLTSIILKTGGPDHVTIKTALLL